MREGDGDDRADAFSAQVLLDTAGHTYHVKGNMALPLITVFRVWSGLGCHIDSQVSTLKTVRAREIRVCIVDEDGSSEQKSAVMRGSREQCAYPSAGGEQHK